MARFRWVARAAPLSVLVVVSASASAQSCPPLEEGRFTGTGGNYGWAIAIDGDLAIVGAATDSSAWILERDAGGQWSERMQIMGPPGAFFFGRAVAISGDTVVIGGAWESGQLTGRAFVHRRDAGGPGAWGQVAELVGSGVPAGLQYAFSVALDGDTAVVGASGDVLDPPDSNPGVAVVFERNLGGPDAWGQRALLQPPLPGRGSSNERRSPTRSSALPVYSGNPCNRR